MSLQELESKLESFYTLIFKGLQSAVANECKISSLVPVVEESYAIYNFITSMLQAMHKQSDDKEVFEPLRNTFKRQHYKLRQFYHDCNQIPYLTSLITIPELPMVYITQFNF